MRTIRIRVVIDTGIGIIRGVVVRVDMLAVGLVVAVAGPDILMVALVILVMVMDVPVLEVLPAVVGRAIRVVVVLLGRRLVITKRGVV